MQGILNMPSNLKIKGLFVCFWFIFVMIITNQSL